MKILVSGCTNTVNRWAAERPDRVGVLRTPYENNALPTAGDWAGDNDCFKGLNGPAYLRFLAKIAEHPHKPQWVTCPDVVADAEGTERLFMVWHRVMLDLGIPIALVLQDGLEKRKWRALLPSIWDKIAAVFVGGTTGFKMSDTAAAICRDAKDRGKRVHVGRVNTRRRIDYFAHLGCVDSIDGSSFSKFGEVNIPKGVRWIDRAILREQKMMFGGVA